MSYEQDKENSEVVEALQRTLFNEALPSLCMSIIGILACAVFFYERVPSHALLNWVLGATLVSGLRFVIILKALNNPDSPAPIRAYTFAMGLLGLLWGTVILLWSPDLNQTDQFLIALLPSVATLCVVAALGSWPACYFSFIVGLALATLYSMNISMSLTLDFIRLLAPLVFLVLGCVYLLMRFNQQKRETLTLNLRNSHALQSKDEFLSRMSHELRTPMNGVLGVVRILRNSSLDEDQQRLLGMLNESGERMLVLVSDLLDAASLASHDVKLESSVCNLPSVMQNIIDSAWEENRGSRVALSFEVDDNFPMGVELDCRRWTQLSQKLLDNAMKFTTEGKIVVTLSRESNELVLAIRDTGCGISPVQLKTVRALFDQEVDKSNLSGSGIGLIIVQGLVSLMKGSVSIDSELNHGTVVQVRVPLVLSVMPYRKNQSPNAELSARKVPTPTPVLRPPRALVAEDNPVNQLVIVTALQELDCDVTVVANGVEALSAMQTSLYDIIFMDCQMPELDGYEATRQAREGGCDLPIIAVTASAVEGDRERCLEAGMDDYISKPIADDALKKVMYKWLGKIQSESTEAFAA